MTETEKAYIAGLFDGEGSVGYYRRKSDGTFIASLRISNTDFRLGKWIRSVLPFGAFKIFHRERHRSIWEWEIRGKRRIQEVATQLLPYLVVKKDQVELLLSLLGAEREVGCKAGTKAPEHIQQLRNDVLLKLKELKNTATYITH